MIWKSYRLVQLKQRKGHTHHPVPGNFIWSRARQIIVENLKVLYLHALMQWAQVAVDGRSGMRLKDQVVVHLHSIRAFALKPRVYCLVYCYEASICIPGTRYGGIGAPRPPSWAQTPVGCPFFMVHHDKLRPC